MLRTFVMFLQVAIKNVSELINLFVYL